VTDSTSLFTTRPTRTALDRIHESTKKKGRPNNRRNLFVDNSLTQIQAPCDDAFYAE